MCIFLLGERNWNTWRDLAEVGYIYSTINQAFISMAESHLQMRIHFTIGKYIRFPEDMEPC